MQHVQNLFVSRLPIGLRKSTSVAGITHNHSGKNGSRCVLHSRFQKNHFHTHHPLPWRDYATLNNSRFKKRQVCQIATKQKFRKRSPLLYLISIVLRKFRWSMSVWTTCVYQIWVLLRWIAAKLFNLSICFDIILMEHEKWTNLSGQSQCKAFPLKSCPLEIGSLNWMAFYCGCNYWEWPPHTKNSAQLIKNADFLRYHKHNQKSPRETLCLIPMASGLSFFIFLENV